MHSAYAAIVGGALALTLASGVSASAETFRKFSGAQIMSKLAGMEFSDEVHWREVYERTGVVRSYDMGRTRIGKWRVSENRLCTDLDGSGGEDCFEICFAGHLVQMRREADQPNPIAGILRKPTDPAKPGSKN